MVFTAQHLVVTLPSVEEGTESQEIPSPRRAIEMKGTELEFVGIGCRQLCVCEESVLGDSGGTTSSIL